MIAVASLELCQTLYELSGWRDTTFSYRNYLYTSDKGKPCLDRWEVRRYMAPSETAVPAYDLGFLLRKLPPKRVKLRNYGNGKWKCQYVLHHSSNVRQVEDFIFEAGTPEDCAAKLAIELLKQNILKKEVA